MSLCKPEAEEKGLVGKGGGETPAKEMSEAFQRKEHRGGMRGEKNALMGIIERRSKNQGKKKLLMIPAATNGRGEGMGVLVRGDKDVHSMR